MKSICAVHEYSQLWLSFTHRQTVSLDFFRPQDFSLISYPLSYFPYFLPYFGFSESKSPFSTTLLLASLNLFPQTWELLFKDVRAGRRFHFILLDDDLLPCSRFVC
jgi:hypothetical protein